MARLRKANSETTNISLGDEMVDVSYVGGNITTDLHYESGVVRFVDGVASVTTELAVKLRDEGYVR